MITSFAVKGEKRAKEALEYYLKENAKQLEEYGLAPKYLDKKLTLSEIREKLNDKLLKGFGGTFTLEDVKILRPELTPEQKKKLYKNKSN